MEEAILEAIEDAGAQGASVQQIISYVECAGTWLGEEYDQEIRKAIDSMVKNRIIIHRRGRFFFIYND